MSGSESTTSTAYKVVQVCTCSQALDVGDERQWDIVQNVEGTDYTSVTADDANTIVRNDSTRAKQE